MEEVFAAAGAACGAKAAGRRVLAIQDTTHLSFPDRPLGPGGDGETAGLFVHPVLALDASDGNLLGVAAGRVWTRAAGKVSDRRGRALAEKESARWLEEGFAAEAALAAAAHVTLIADRESDIYEEWARLPGPRFDLITRARGDRRLADGEMLFSAVAKRRSAGRRTIDIVARANRAARVATLELKFGEATIKKPASCPATDVPGTIALRLVEAKEIDAPTGVAPVHWRLLTTLAASSADEAWAVVDAYRMRWRIEEYFRTLKRSGLDLEGARLEGSRALINLAAMGAVAAVPVMQLVEGRDAGAERRAAEVIAPETLSFAAALGATLEGKTEKQKNPHEQGSLAWLAWIVARLGGWSGYERYGPAGPKTMAAGWERFTTMQHGWALRRNV